MSQTDEIVDQSGPSPDWISDEVETSSECFPMFRKKLSTDATPTVPKAPTKVLCVGIEYGKELVGCSRDAKNFMDCILASHPGAIPEKSRRLMLEGSGGSSKKRDKPTRKNLLAALDWLVEGANSSSRLVFYYSGHGTYRKGSKDSGEDDGQDEAICPLDYDQEGFVYDNDLRSRLVQRVPSGAKLLCVFDCCNSRSTLDLRYNLRDGSPGATPRVEKRYSRPKGEVVYVGACRDEEVDLTTDFEGGYPQSVMTFYLVKILENALVADKPQTFRQVLEALRTTLRDNGFDQRPQISVGRDASTLDQPFSFV
jgi:hypothetical protein